MWRRGGPAGPRGVAGGGRGALHGCRRRDGAYSLPQAAQLTGAVTAFLADTMAAPEPRLDYRGKMVLAPMVKVKATLVKNCPDSPSAGWVGALPSAGTAVRSRHRLLGGDDRQAPAGQQEDRQLGPRHHRLHRRAGQQPGAARQSGGARPAGAAARHLGRTERRPPPSPSCRTWPEST